MSQEQGLPEGANFAADLDDFFRGGGKFSPVPTPETPSILPTEKAPLSGAAQKLIWDFLQPRFNKPPSYSLREKAEKFKKEFGDWKDRLGNREGAAEVTMEAIVQHTKDLFDNSTRELGRTVPGTEENKKWRYQAECCSYAEEVARAASEL